MKWDRITHLAWTSQWRHNERDGVSNHRCIDCLLNRVFRRISTKISKLQVTVLCEGNSPVTGEFPSQRASNAENVSIWWRHHEFGLSANELKGNKTMKVESVSGQKPQEKPPVAIPYNSPDLRSDWNFFIQIFNMIRIISAGSICHTICVWRNVIIPMSFSIDVLLSRHSYPENIWSIHHILSRAFDQAYASFI